MDRNEWMKWARIGLFLILSFLITWLVRLDFPTITRPAGAIRVDAGVYATLGDICIALWVPALQIWRLPLREAERPAVFISLAAR